MKQKWGICRRQLSNIVEVGASDDFISRAYDIMSTVILVLNLVVSVMYTFEKLRIGYGELLLSIEAVTVLFLPLIFFSGFLPINVPIPICRSGRLW